jgi:predicted MFS family arabinose efflux permease
MPIGGAIGAVSSSYFISVLSRKHVLLLFNAISILLALLSLYPDYRVLLIVRLLQGGCCGLFSATVPLIVK